MGVKANQAQINKAAKDLWIQWSSTRSKWQDENARKFEKQYLDRLRAQLRMSASALDHLDMVLNRVRRDCK